MSTKFAEGNRKFLSGEYKEAYRLYKAAIEKNPDIFIYHDNLAFAYKKLKKGPSAVQFETSAPKCLTTQARFVKPKDYDDVYKVLKESKLVNEKWYLSQHPEVQDSQLDAVSHYISLGAHRGFNPCKRFNTAVYMSNNPEVDFNRINPLYHYIKNMNTIRIDGVRIQQADISGVSLAGIEEYNKGYLAYFGERLIAKIKKEYNNGSEGEAVKHIRDLVGHAEDCLHDKVYSVIDKTTLPPSRNIKDYWHPAPYWWPNPDSLDGVPYVYKDGERVPGTRMYEPLSDKYDRTSIQKVFDETLALALAWFFTDDDRFAKKAYKLIKTWFIDEPTSMAPHLKYAQVVIGKNNNLGKPTGLIETKDLYYFLDAVRLIKRSKYWFEDDSRAFDSWCETFLVWLESSEQGKAECSATNNHGIAYDLQVYALSAFLGDRDRMESIAYRAIKRMPNHFDVNGYQHREMERTTTAHYTAFNLQLWMSFGFLLLNTAKYNLFSFSHQYDKNVSVNPLIAGVEWILKHMGEPWPYEQIDEFDVDRHMAIYRFAKALKVPLSGINHSEFDSVSNDVKSVFFPHDGIAPYSILNCFGKSGPADFTEHRYVYEKTEIRKRIVAHLWGGLSDQAIGALREVIYNEGYPRSTRAYCAWELSRWYAFISDDGMSLAYLKHIENLNDVFAASKAFFLSISFIYIRANDLQLAQVYLRRYMAENGQDSDILLAYANTVRSEEERLRYINKVFENANCCPIAKIDNTKPLSLSNIRGEAVKKVHLGRAPKVSVIMPVFNAEQQLRTAVRSLLDQTWSNVEIIIVDDCSSDRTYHVACELAETDSRIIPLRLMRNGGAYRARNLGLQYATGNFITTHDSDDWSHPNKIQRQIEYLQEHCDVKGVTANWVRTKEDLYFTQNWRPANTLIHKSESSFMFRKEVYESIGVWDEVRVGGDNEYIGRMMSYFGKESYQVIYSSVPLAFGLDDEGSLTRTKATHVSTVYNGLRHLYREIWGWAHGLEKRHQVHLPLKMTRKSEAVNKMDLLLVADYCDPDSARYLFTTCEEHSKDAVIGLLHTPTFNVTPSRFAGPYFDMLRNYNAFPVDPTDKVFASTVVSCNIDEKLLRARYQISFDNFLLRREIP